MLHLPAERLAALADEEPTTTEGEHLARCAQCTRERESYRCLLALANGEGSMTTLPLTRWETLAPALRAEGLVTERAIPVRTVRRWGLGSGALRAAAAVLLFAGGAFIGRASATSDPAATTGGSSADATPVLPAADTSPAFESPAQALAALASYERAYQAAASYLAENDTATRITGTRETYEARLATLDRVAEATEQALRERPYDPVISGYHLTTNAARQATLRQLSTSVQPNVRVGGY